MSKLIAIFTVSAHHLVAATEAGKVDAVTASWCLKSCEKAQAYDAFESLASFPKDAEVKSKAQRVQKELLFATTCEPFPIYSN